MFLQGKRWLLLILGCLVISLVSCSRNNDETALRELVKKAARLAEQHDIGGIMDLTTDDFMAGPGDLDRRGSKGILFMTFRHYGQLKVLHPQPSVNLEAKNGGPQLSFPFLILKKEQEMPELKKLYEDPRGWLEKVGENADLYRFRLEVVKVEGEWLVRRATLERFTGMGFGH